MPGEQWLLFGSPQEAEAYLGTYPAEAAVEREPWPNEEGLYARIRLPGRIQQDRIYIGTS